jgi:hypothetical protein
MSNWGKGSENNNIGWGQAAHTATNDWGKSHKTSLAGLTDIVGDPALSISYSASALCENASNPTPTVSGNEGSGTFSSTTGLVFVSTSTGEVNISSSTAGATYLITYTDTNAATATFSLTINNLDSAAFAYSASSYEPTDADPTPTITGLTGGTFSSTSGLVFVDSGTNTGSSTGEIDLSATTEASYTITYDTTSSGSSVCPNTSTQSVEVAVAGIANNYSMSFDGSNDYIDVGTSLKSTFDAATTASVSLWFKASSISSSTAAVLFQQESVDAGDNWSFVIRFSTSGQLQTGIKVGSTFPLATYTTGLNTSAWYNVVSVYESSTLKLYLNGAKVAENLSTGSPIVTSSSNAKAIIGATASPNRYFNGQIDEVAIWNTALTSTQVSEIYSATSTNLTKDLTTVSGSNLVYWNRMGD